MKEIKLPYFDERSTDIDMLVFHCSSEDSEAMIGVLQKLRLSAHYVIGVDGEIIRLVSEEKRAWHAGVSMWRGKENINHNSIGIEISSASMGQKPYNQKQIDSVVSLSKEIIVKYGIKPQNVVGHSDITPTRKPDPGKAFPWQYLAQSGVGLWYDLADADKVCENDVEVLLKGIGYDVSNLEASLCAFCRHFMPDKVDTVDDINELVKNPCGVNLVVDDELLRVIKACYWAYQKKV